MSVARTLPYIVHVRVTHLVLYVRVTHLALHVRVTHLALHTRIARGSTAPQLPYVAGLLRTVRPIAIGRDW